VPVVYINIIYSSFIPSNRCLRNTCIRSLHFPSLGSLLSLYRRSVRKEFAPFPRNLSRLLSLSPHVITFHIVLVYGLSVSVHSRNLTRSLEVVSASFADD